MDAPSPTGRRVDTVQFKQPFLGDWEAVSIGISPDAAVTWRREDQMTAELLRHAKDVDADVLDALDDYEIPLVEGHGERPVGPSRLES